MNKKTNLIMKRSSFLKSLFTLVIAPKIVAEINFDKLAASNIAAYSSVANSTFFADLNLLLPEYSRQMIEKHGSENYLLIQNSRE